MHKCVNSGTSVPTVDILNMVYCCMAHATYQSLFKVTQKPVDSLLLWT